MSLSYHPLRLADVSIRTVTMHPKKLLLSLLRDHCALQIKT
jgi:hypothetical protein